MVSVVPLSGRSPVQVDHVLVVWKRQLSVGGFMVNHLWSQVAFMVLLFKVC